MHTPTSDKPPPKPWITLPDPERQLQAGQVKLKIKKLSDIRHPEYRIECLRVLADGREMSIPRYKVKVSYRDGACLVESLAVEFGPLFDRAAWMITQDAQKAEDEYVLARAKKRRDG
jgi:hypothetical protein